MHNKQDENAIEIRPENEMQSHKPHKSQLFKSQRRNQVKLHLKTILK